MTKKNLFLLNVSPKLPLNIVLTALSLLEESFLHFFSIGLQVLYKYFRAGFWYKRSDNLFPFGGFQTDHLHFIIYRAAHRQDVLYAGPNGEHRTGKHCV